MPYLNSPFRSFLAWICRALLTMLCLLGAAPASAQPAYYLKVAATGTMNPNPGAHYNVTLEIVSSFPGGYPLLYFKDSSFLGAGGASSSSPSQKILQVYVFGVPPKLKLINRSTGATVATLEVPSGQSVSNAYTVTCTSCNGNGFRLADGTIIGSATYFDGSETYASLGYSGGGILLRSAGNNACGSSYGTVSVGGVGDGTVYGATSGVCGWPQQAQYTIPVGYLLGY